MDGIDAPRFDEPDAGKMGWFRSIFQVLQRRTKAATVTSAYTVASDVGCVFANATGGTITVTLPASLSWGGRPITVIKTDSSTNAVTVSRTGSDLINGATTQPVGLQYHAVTFRADGTTNWNITAKYPATVS